MLTLSLNNIAIPIPADFSMELVVNSPFARFDAIPFSYSVDVSIPINEYTAAILWHPEIYSKFRTGNDQKFKGFEVRFDGVLLLAGTLKVTGVQGKSYDCTIIDLTGVLSEELQNKSILDIAKFSEEIDWNNQPEYNSETSPYACPAFSNADFFKDKGVGIERPEAQWVYNSYTGQWNKEESTLKTELLSYLFKNTTNGVVNIKLEDGTVLTEANAIDASVIIYEGNTYDVGRLTVVSPMFFLIRIITDALKVNLFFIDPDNNYLTENEDIKKICIYNNFDITKIGFNSVTEFSEPEYVTISGIGDPNDINILSSFSYTTNEYTRSYEPTFKPVNHLPKMSLGELLVSTQNLLNVCFDFSPNAKVSIFHRDAVLKGASIDISKYFLGEWEIGEKKNTTLKFTRKHDDNDGVFSEKYTDLADRKSDIKEPVTDWNELKALTGMQEGEIRFIKDTQQFVEYKWFSPENINETTLTYTTNDAWGWKVVSIGLQNGWWKYGRDEQEEIATKWSTLFGNSQNSSTLQQGNMNAWKNKQQSFSPRLIFNSAGTGTNETPTLSMEYEKEEIGIIPKLWKRTADWYSDRLPVAGTFDFPVNMLQYLIFNKCKKYSTKEGAFIADEIRCTLFVNRISETTIKGYKV